MNNLFVALLHALPLAIIVYTHCTYTIGSIKLFEQNYNTSCRSSLNMIDDYYHNDNLYYYYYFFLHT